MAVLGVHPPRSVGQEAWTQQIDQAETEGTACSASSVEQLGEASAAPKKHLALDLRPGRRVQPGRVSGQPQAGARSLQGV